MYLERASSKVNREKAGIDPPSQPQLLPSQQPGSETFSSCVWSVERVAPACSSRRASESQPESSQQPVMVGEWKEEWGSWGS